MTSGYQAEYGRSSGMQITAITKSGTSQLRGSIYDTRIEAFNVLNSVLVNARNTTIHYASLADATAGIPNNLPYDASGNLITGRNIPQSAGFGVATGPGSSIDAGSGSLRVLKSRHQPREPRRLLRLRRSLWCIVETS